HASPLSQADQNCVQSALGNLVRVNPPPGQRHDTTGVAALIKDVTFKGLIADKAFDTDPVIADLNARKAKIVLSQD
ncbi:MAG: hypothetical protein WCS20_16280, partial [Alphaproteobacteria bacterium]